MEKLQLQKSNIKRISIDFKRKLYSKELSKNIKGKKIGIPKEYRVEGMPNEIEDLWSKGIEYVKGCGA